MANYVYNTFAFKGKINDVKVLINEGLVNSTLKPFDYIKEGFNALISNAKTLDRVYHYRICVHEAPIKYYNELTMRTFLPMPVTFLKFDTTNCKKIFKEEADKQKEEYGVVGWYEYNIKTLGCKQNATLFNPEIEVNEEEDIAIIFFDCDTPWSYPEYWLKTIKDKFNLQAFICTHEEGNAFSFYKEIDGCEHDFENDIFHIWDDFLDRDDYETEEYEKERERLSEEENDFLDNKKKEFKEFVRTYTNE